MKKYLFISACLVVSLVFLIGCSNSSNSISTTETDITVKETALNQLSDTTDWETTTYETVNNFDGVTMIVKKGTTTTDGLTVAFENNTDKKCTYGNEYMLEKKINDGWYQVPVAIEGNYAFTSIGYDVSYGQKRELAVDWHWLYGSLDAGEYRIVKSILDSRNPGDYDTYFLAAEFTIY